MPHHLFEIMYPRDQVLDFERNMFNMREKLYDQLSEQIRSNQSVDDMQDIFNQIVKNNDTKYDSIKWSLKRINQIGIMNRKDRIKELDQLFEDYRFGNTKMERYQKV